ncbi:DUF4832 domain-containing protein [Trinickia fusca]|uniref:DUF4832 domain-containing protein n=1 Tax=Trinickia fusca TaxID=2419777 RepID=A0A494XP70_9BURK|nr:DUF4832 domain-containing protein [Trinickia fusca]RKP50556.1 DUF4832 domain-containing protein [Trinickia fusca]
MQCNAYRCGQLPIGLRRDSLGSYTGWSAGFPVSSSCRSADGTDLVATRWQRAPFVVEPFGNGSSPTFPCQTFELDPTTNQLAILEEVQQYHIADIKNASFCTGSWSALTQTEQAAIWTAGLSAGYRYAPAAVDVQIAPAARTGRRFRVTTQWSNTGTTPTYTRWQIEFRARPQRNAAGLPSAPWQPAARFVSAADLRKVLPGSTAVFGDEFVLPKDVLPGSYELDVRVLDAPRYLKPMQLSLANALGDGYYVLGTIQVPNDDRRDGR